MKRQEVVSVLKNKILPVCQEGEARYQILARESQDVFWKKHFILYWQKYAQCVAEVEQKIRLHGGNLESAPATLPSAYSAEDLKTCIHAEQQALYIYVGVLKDSLPIDMRMMLEVHVVIFTRIKEELKRATPTLQPSMTQFSPSVS